MTAPTSALSAMGPAARDAYDGQPFFCTWCGGEWDTNECASGCCELESEAKAEQRAWLHEAEDACPICERVGPQHCRSPEIPALSPITTPVARLNTDLWTLDELERELIDR